uniref:Interferon-induced very large GTPase 1 n=1 Tax=Xenopus tropicalis TaxID=8364 RepID=A0A803JXH6_XENTR
MRICSCNFTSEPTLNFCCRFHPPPTVKMSGRCNVKVAVRVGPMNTGEDKRQSVCIVDMDQKKITLQPFTVSENGEISEAREFTFDHCFWSVDNSCPDNYAGQEDIFGTLGQEIGDNTCQGYNSCIFAYGQTGSGKTFSIMGTDNEPGLIPRFCSALFSGTNVLHNLKVEVSFMEIYKEEVRDLLQGKQPMKNLRVREHKVIGPYVEGLSQHAVSNPDDINFLLAAGNKSRLIEATDVNVESNQSHAIFTLTVTHSSHHESGTLHELLSTVSFVDLAGSERTYKSDDDKNDLAGCMNIDESLTALRTVIASLADKSKENKEQHIVNYHNSVLTWLLKNNLGGNSRTVMLATISPTDISYMEAVSTLTYADMAQKIVNYDIVNKDVQRKRIQKLQEEVRRLSKQTRKSQKHNKNMWSKLTETKNLLREAQLPWEEKLKNTARVVQDQTRHHRGAFGFKSSRCEYEDMDSGICRSEEENKINVADDKSHNSQTTTCPESISGRIQKSQKELTEFIHLNFDELLDKFVSECLLTWKDCFEIESKNDGMEKTEMLYTIISGKEVKICERFLQILEKENLNKNGEEGGQPNIKNENKETDKAVKNSFGELLAKMKMESYRSNKLSLRTFLQIVPDCSKALHTCSNESLAWNFIHKIIALNGTARNISIINESSDKRFDDYLNDDSEWDITSEASNSIHPLDVLCVILHCSDHFLQQEIFSKISLCQFAVPLLLPDTDGSSFTFMLWVMRDIVKRWRPESLSESKGFREENLVQISMPTFSFVRLGESKLSKSKTLNQVLSPAHLNHNWFVHDNMEGGNSTRSVSDGVVEIAWYFPAGNKSSDIFPEPVAATNLRGNLESNIKQFDFLMQISAAVIIFIQTINADQYELLLNYKNAKTELVFIIIPKYKLDKDTREFLKALTSSLNKVTVLVFDKATTKAAFVKRVQSTLIRMIRPYSDSHSIEEMAHTASTLGFSIDENVKECQTAKAGAKVITDEIVDVVKYKRKTMKLQGDSLKELARLEKEMCQMKRQGNDSSEHYKSKIIKKRATIRKQQNDCEVPSGIKNFIKAIKNKNSGEKQYFLKWIRFYLDLTARQNLSALQEEYKRTYNSASKEMLSVLDKKMSDTSLGIEHFLRELSQIYEADSFIIKDINKRKFKELPGIAADLLLDGFPLELIDGDASNIPLHWIQDVLTQLDEKTGKKCRIRTITVLGVQSTGKSTLLNTMFGLQFPVANGRCTRGAFMSLLKVEENFQRELGCEFILVIDTEGLKAPELASLDDSYEHDNELATLVVGLSDITLFNMAMENTTEMKDTLQIVVHAFLRMKEIGKKPNCQFVHQNVSDVSAHEKNMRDRKRFLEQLNEMTEIAAKMEKKYTISKFSEMMEYDLEKHNWYIPGLWHGVPPMAPVNTGYSNSIHELKKHLLEIMQTCKAVNIAEYITWISSLWNAVKHENFIFSFRNSLVAKAYNQLAKKYSELEWNFDKTMLEWLTRTEIVIKNQSMNTVEEKAKECINKALYILSEEQKKMESALEDYFNKETEILPLIERYREDFFNSIRHHRRKHESTTTSKVEETVVIQKQKHKIQCIQDRYIETIETKVTSLLEDCRNKQHQPDEMELSQEFEMMWTNTIEELKITRLQRHSIESKMLEIITKDMKNRGSSVNEKLQQLKRLPRPNEKLEKNTRSIKNSIVNVLKYFVRSSSESKNPIKEDPFLSAVLHRCSQYVKRKVASDADYNDAYCWELMKIINDMCEQNDGKSLQLHAEYELNLKIYALGHAMDHFQQMHDEFIEKNDPLSRLTALKPMYLATFKNTFQEKDESFNRAKRFCECCIKPALADQINRILGIRIVDDVLSKTSSLVFKDRTFFQYTLLKNLINEKDFQEYISYTKNYEEFTKNWIQKYLVDTYGNFSSLQCKIVSDAIQRIKDILREPEILECNNMPEFFVTFCANLDEELALNQDEMKAIVFKNSATVKEFTNYVCNSLNDTEEELMSEIEHEDSESVLCKLTIKPEDELFKKVIGCGKQCPFCKVPCEAGATNHKKHFATIHRPQGLGTYRDMETKILAYEICSTEVVSNKLFINSDTRGKRHPYRDYCTYYPDWAIQPDPSIDASDYWKFVLKEFNK